MIRLKMAFCAVFRIEFGFCFQVDAISNREKHKDQICPAVWWLEVRFELDLAKSDRSMERRSHSSGHLSRWQREKTSVGIRLSKVFPRALAVRPFR